MLRTTPDAQEAVKRVKEQGDASTELVPEQGAAFGPTLEFMARIWELNHTIEVTSKRSESTLGVTSQQRVMLRMIGRAPGITQGQLAKLLHLHKTTLSLAIDRLEKRELVTRERDESDGRRVGLRLTAKGTALDKPSKGTVESAVEAMLAKLPRDQVEATLGCLLVLVRNLEEEQKR